ncbi:hypothetical protein BDF20DRAFT_820570 [Mycotypha africana]|uniref:uncharacterized protein n=1 Tax=Mycotypha africana TaxID=64632 RepID=UPI002301631D|nr:uncharacterized protein BDF20DRAFT_820570 [Mycotypha africana]KAI8977427.1 hypothetical protein BDF20DRAFT_820570 [Mycotypha africana]
MSGFQTIASAASVPTQNHFQYHRQNSVSSITLPNNVSNIGLAGINNNASMYQVANSSQGDDWQTLCVRVLPLFNGEGVQGSIEDLNELLRLVEQWSFFFTYALPYFEAVFLPLRTDVQYRSPDEAEMWDVRTMALRSFRDNVILLQTKRLEDVFNKLFTDFGSSQNPAATAAKMLQMTSLLASSPDHNEEIERVLSNLKANWKIMMTKGDRRGFAGLKKR